MAFEAQEEIENIYKGVYISKSIIQIVFLVIDPEIDELRYKIVATRLTSDVIISLDN